MINFRFGRNTLKRLLAFLPLLIVLCLPQFSLAQQAVPALSARVIDQTGMLSSSEIASLDQVLSAFEKRKGSQLAVLIVPTTAPESIEQFGIRVAEQWKLGRKKVDDGAVLIIAKADRTLRIEVGYGLEGALTDATSKRIIDDIIVPRFKQQDFYGGVLKGASNRLNLLENAFDRDAGFAVRGRVLDGLLAEPPHAADNRNDDDHEADQVFAHGFLPRKLVSN